MKNLKIIIFGSDSCPECKRQKEEFSKLSIPFDFVDALAESNQDLCDHMDVEDLPHTICIYEDTLKPVHVSKGFCNAQFFMDRVVQRISSGRQTSFRSSLSKDLVIKKDKSVSDADIIK